MSILSQTRSKYDIISFISRYTHLLNCDLIFKTKSLILVNEIKQ